MWPKQLQINKDYPPFHLINVMGWGIVCFVDIILINMVDPITTINRFLGIIVYWSCGLFITIYLRSIYINYNYKSYSLFKVLFYILFNSIAASIIHYFVAQIIFSIFISQNLSELLNVLLTLNSFLRRNVLYIPMYTTWSLFYFGIKFWLDSVADRQRSEKAELLLQSAHLQMLRYQINPHFLFNAFSSLRALIRVDSIKAEEMLSKLSDFFRYSLMSKNEAEVALKYEIEALTNYFAIERIRFEDKIEIKYNIEEAAYEYPVPVFLIHPLVENSIKYGMRTSTLPLKIAINIFVEDGFLKIEVRNSGKWVDEERIADKDGTGTGLKNIKRRLEFSYPGNYTFKIDKSDLYVSVTITLFKELK